MPHFSIFTTLFYGHSRESAPSSPALLHILSAEVLPDQLPKPTGNDLPLCWPETSKAVRFVPSHSPTCSNPAYSAPRQGLGSTVTQLHKTTFPLPPLSAAVSPLPSAPLILCSCVAIFCSTAVYPAADLGQDSLQFTCVDE